MIHEINVNKAVITAINLIILAGLPLMLAWHIRRVSKTKHLTYDWMIQIIIVFLYVLAINCEIPALWSRLITYYDIKLSMPDLIYKLSTWDRWGHAIFYGFFFLLTYTISVKKVPKLVSDTLSDTSTTNKGGL